jgi:glutamine synthetase
MKKTSNGRYTIDEVKEGINNREIEYVTLAIFTTYGLYYKRYEAEYFLKTILPDGAKFPEIILTKTIVNEVSECDKINFNNIGDVIVKPDLNTFRYMSWLGPGHIIVLGDMLNIDGSEFNVHYPRNILKRLIKTFDDKYGVTFKGASELEYYLLNSKCRDIVSTNPKINIDEFRFTNKASSFAMADDMDYFEKYNKKIKDNIKSCGIELENLFTEFGPAQHEINIKYSEILNNCDNHVILKQCIKQTAKDLGIGCTFMAKLFIDLVGSSSHIHISAYKDGNNFWAPSENSSENQLLDNGKAMVNIHNNMFYFIGGLLKYSQELFLVYAPYINSYKRYQKNSFAPCYLNSWSYDSRTSALRVVGEGDNLHMEFRICSSDINPYLAYSALIASGMKGIEDNIVPPKMEKENSYLRKDGLLPPRTLYEAIKLFEKSEFAEEIFGKDYKSLILILSNVEWNSFLNHISNYEVNRYLDSV